MINRDKIKLIKAYSDNCGSSSSRPKCEKWNGDCSKCSDHHPDWQAELLNKHPTTLIYTCMLAEKHVPGVAPICKLSIEEDVICDIEKCTSIVSEWLQDDFKKIFNGFDKDDK